MTTRRIQVGSRKWNISIKPTLNVGLLVMMVFLSSVLACSKVKEEGDPKSLSYDHYCPDVPAGVTCPSGSGDNTTTTSGTVMREYFNLDESESGASEVLTAKMYWGTYYPSEGYWYMDVNSKLQQGCMPLQQTNPNVVGGYYDHYSTAHYWNRWQGTGTDRNSEPPYARCYRMWKTDNATGCYGQQLCLDRGKTQFKRSLIMGQSEDWTGDYGPSMHWGPGHMDNVSLIGQGFTCVSYPNGQCTTTYTTKAFQDNHTGKVLDNGSYDGHEVPPYIWGNITHFCTKEDGSSCAYVD